MTTLTSTTLERLRSFRIPGFIDAMQQQSESRHYYDLSFEDRITLLVDAEHTRRLEQRTNRILHDAKLPSSLTLEDVDFAANRGLKKNLTLELAQGGWVKSGTNLIVTGQTGVGKTFLSSVIARSLCQRGVQVRFKRTHHWLAELMVIDERRRFPQTVANYRRVPLLIFDEWLRDSPSVQETRLLLDLFDDRYAKLSCMFISQFPVDAWHAKFPDPTLADAILDRLVHNSIRVELSGDSMRRAKTLPGPLEDNVASLR